MIQFGRIWYNLIKKWIKLKIWWYISMINEIQFDQVWSILIHFGQIWWYISMIISSEIHFDHVWSILIHFGQIWFNPTKNWIKLKIWLFHRKSNLIKFEPYWTDLIQSDQKINKVQNLMIYFWNYFIRNPIWLSLIHFDPFLMDLIQSDQK